MRGNTIFTECHIPVWLDVAHQLARDLGCTPAYWIAPADFSATVRQHFPDAVVHLRVDAIRGIPPPEFSSLPLRGIGEDVISRLSVVQITALRMMDRFDTGDAFSYAERVELFFHQLRYWRTVFERLEPEYAIFPVQPHMLYDYIIYELCKEYGVRTCMFQWTPLPNVVFPLEQLELPSSDLATAYAELLERSSVSLSSRATAYVARIKGPYAGAMPGYIANNVPGKLRRELLGTADGQPDVTTIDTFPTIKVPKSGGAVSTVLPSAPVGWRKRLRRSRKALREAAKHLRARVRRHATHWPAQGRRAATKAARRLTRAGTHTFQTMSGQRSSARLAKHRKATRRVYRRWLRPVLTAFSHGGSQRPLKERSRSMVDSFSGPIGGLREQVTRLRGFWTKRRLRYAYDRLTHTVDLSMPYVFVALQYQPEQTTCPTGGVFADQFLMVDLVSQSVPDGWLVYVKEHPYQFVTVGIGERGRSAELYEELAALPNVRLVPLTMSPFDLIDRSRAVATVSGTPGIEAVLRGQPCLAFGYAWYRGCEGVFYTPTVDACRQAMTEIAAGYAVDVAKVEAFIAATEQIGSVVDLRFGTETEKIPSDVNGQRVTEAILSVWSRQPPLRNATPGAPTSVGQEPPRGMVDVVRTPTALTQKQSTSLRTGPNPSAD